jgi:hypothetical protein
MTDPQLKEQVLYFCLISGFIFPLFTFFSYGLIGDLCYYQLGSMPLSFQAVIIASHQDHDY